jgi:hypothetical protein
VTGAAAAGIAGAVAAKNRAGVRRHRKRGRLAGISLPKRNGKLDLDSVASAAQRVGQLARQVSDVASTIETTSKRAKK